MAVYNDAEAMCQLLDALPIYATKIGYRDDSTPEETALAGAMFELAEHWNRLRADLEAL